MYKSKGKIVIGIGRGVTNKALDEIKIFAKRYHIPVMGSRAAVEMNYITTVDQIGQSGNTICVPLYIAVGISGAIQHIIGVMKCKKIISINIDKDAPICEWADVNICADCYDLFKILNSEKF